MTPKANPFNANSSGGAFFHVAGGLGPYQITATKGAFSTTFRYVAIGLLGEADQANTSLLANNAVDSNQIANGAVINAKLADMAQATFKMRAAAAGTGDPIDGTATQAKTALAIAAADVSGVVAQGLHTIWIPATAMVTRTTNGAAAGTTEKATNKNMFKTFDFDTTTQEFVQFAIRMPKSWDEGTITFVPVWSHAAAVTNFGVAFGLAGVAISNDDAGDVAFGTAQMSVDTGGTTDDIYQGPASSAITIAGTPAAEDLIMFQVNRTVSDGGDNLGIDARLHGITIYFTVNASTDA